MPPRTPSKKRAEPASGIAAPPIRATGKGKSKTWFLIIPLLVGAIAYATYAFSAEQKDTGYTGADIEVTGTPRVSIVMIAHNENHYLQRTFDSIMQNSPLENLLEIVFVDDASDPPASTILDPMNNPRIKIIRHEERQGLIRAKTTGARAAKGELLVFLDAHVRTYPGWLEPMMRLTTENYRRVVVPMIPVLDGSTWEQVKNYVGVKLIFDWKMDFIWYVDDDDDYVPIMSGGLLAITKKWFLETGEYDMGMLQWGGENVEQSVKIWLCGGEIVVARSSKVGHVFRDVSPYELNITQIHVNKARAIDVWFDEWANYYYRSNPFDKDRRSSPESLAPRFEIKKNLGCKPFSTFVDRFKNVMIRVKLLPTEIYALRHKATGLCVELFPDGHLKGAQCRKGDRAQIFIHESWDRLRSGKFTDDCWEEQTPLRVGLCTAHEPKQKNWQVDDMGILRHQPERGAPVCVRMDPQGIMSMANTCSDRDAFEKYNKAPYSHDLYK